WAVTLELKGSSSSCSLKVGSMKLSWYGIALSVSFYWIQRTESNSLKSNPDHNTLSTKQWTKCSPLDWKTGRNYSSCQRICMRNLHHCIRVVQNFALSLLL
ncbi:hypothetical protein XENOCAPTIV_004233, partial [Xenoophorus captivus]